MTLLVIALGVSGIGLLVWGGMREMKRNRVLTTPILHQPVYISDDEMRTLGWRQIPGKPWLWEPDFKEGDNERG